MTFCVAMKVIDGLVGIADTRITSGVERTMARKVSIHQHGRHSMFVMTSGLRAVRDKALTYFEEVLEESGETFCKLYGAVNALADQIRRVAREDKAALEESGLQFNLHSIVGGQLEKDKEHKLYLLYPQANWIEVTHGTPYFCIGESSYGKALLDRFLSFETSIDMALKMGYLAFNATRVAATDVDYPIDVVLYKRGTYTMVEHRYEREDLEAVGLWWQEHLLKSMELIPSQWVHKATAKLPKRVPPSG
jgi:putative proteasome-type protease